MPVLSGDKGALVPYIVTWKLNGEEMRIERLLTKLDDKRELDERICVRVNAGMGADAILGKAERKIKAAIYARLTGSDLTDGDVDDVDKRKPVRGLADLTTHLEKLPVNGSSATDRPATGTEPDPLLIDEARAAFTAAFEDGKLATVSKVEEELRNKARDDPTRTAISGLADETRQRIRSSPSFQQRAKQKELAGT